MAGRLGGAGKSTVLDGHAGIDQSRYLTINPDGIKERAVRPSEVIRAQADSEWGSGNRRTFEQVKARFTDWAIYDNSVTSRDPQLIQTGYGGKREEER